MSITILGTHEKQPGDTDDVDFDYTDWLLDKEDAIDTATVVSSSPLVLVVEETTVSGGIVKAMVSGGVDGDDYTLTCTVTTTRAPTPRVKESEVTVKVREVPQA